MDDIPIGLLLAGTLFLLVLLVAVVSAELSLLGVRRSHLRHLAAAGDRNAQLADELLRKPDRIRTVARIVKVFLIVVGTAGVTLVLARLQEPLVLGSGLVLFVTAVVLCLQWLPRHIRSERIAWLGLAAHFFSGLLSVFAPAIKGASKRNVSDGHRRDASSERRGTRHSTLQGHDVADHRALHERVADLDNITVDDIMVPRSDLASIDVTSEWDHILNTLRSTPHTRLPVSEGGIDNIIGIVHMKKVAHALARGELSKQQLIELAQAREPYFALEGTSLSDQLVNFKRDRRRVAMVVDEYGDIQGLVTLEDILEEIVGEFTTGPTILTREVHRENEDTYIVSGAASVRDLNRTLGWDLPVDGPRTLNGLIVEHLETIPQPGTCFRLHDLSIEILQTAENAVRSVRVRKLQEEPELSKGMV